MDQGHSKAQLLELMTMAEPAEERTVMELAEEEATAKHMERNPQQSLSDGDLRNH